MKVVIVGYGRMGREIERLARADRHTVAATVDPGRPDATAQRLSANVLSGADVVIDFSHADGVLENLRIAAEAGRPVVIGTTGWDASLTRAKEIVEAAGTGMIHAPNFAIGVQALFRAVDDTARWLDRALAGEFDAGVSETHHAGKADSPSGTARRLARILVDACRQKDAVVADRLERAIAPNELHVASLRMGAEPGTHTAIFDLGDETIRIEHRARSRAIFARGALKAAEWIVGRRGVYEFSEMLGEGGGATIKNGSDGSV